MDQTGSRDWDEPAGVRVATGSGFGPGFGLDMHEQEMHDPPMPRLLLGLVCGLVFGGLVVALMMPMQFPDKRAALWGAFANRLAVGILIGASLGSPQLIALRW